MRILVIDNEGKLLLGIDKSYVVEVAHSGVDGAYQSQDSDYDAIVVGAMLTDIDGIEVCRMTRELHVLTPILLISDVDKVIALNSGADICEKPNIKPEELHAQLRALIRRSKGFDPSSEIRVGDVAINQITRKVYQGKSEIFLRRREYDTLEYLFLNRGRILSKENILEHVWEKGLYVTSNSLEVHVKNIRNRLGANVIRTVHGFGYTVDA